MPGFFQIFKSDLQDRFSGLTWKAAVGFDDPEEGPQGGFFSKLADVVGALGGVFFGMVIMAAFYGVTGFRGIAGMVGFGFLLGLWQKIHGADDDTVLGNFVGAVFMTGILSGLFAYVTARTAGTAADCVADAVEAAARAAYITLGGSAEEKTSGTGKTKPPEGAGNAPALRNLLARTDTGKPYLSKFFNDAASAGGAGGGKGLQKGVASSATAAAGAGTGTQSPQSFGSIIGLE